MVTRDCAIDAHEGKEKQTNSVRIKLQSQEYILYLLGSTGQGNKSGNGKATNDVLVCVAYRIMCDASYLLLLPYR